MAHTRVKNSVGKWAFGPKLDWYALADAQYSADAVAGYHIVFEAMELDNAYTNRSIS